MPTAIIILVFVIGTVFLDDPIFLVGIEGNNRPLMPAGAAMTVGVATTLSHVVAARRYQPRNISRVPCPKTALIFLRHTPACS